MKKKLLTPLFVSFIVCSFAQNVVNSSSKNVISTAPIGGFTKLYTISESVIGKTNWDAQTTGSISNRLIKHADGTLSASWVTLVIPQISNLSRGTGYNYFNGNSWGPVNSNRLESIRTGSTNIVATSSGKEMIIAQTYGHLYGIFYSSRATKGTGVWTEDSTLLGQGNYDVWPKAISGGTNGNSIHAIWQGAVLSGIPYAGQDGPLLYSRSTDGGITWPVLRSILPPIDSTVCLGFRRDCYSIDSHGDTIAIVVGDWTTDLTLLKSLDNGTTWTKTVIQAFPVPFYDPLVDSIPDYNMDGLSDDLESPSGDAHVMLDNNGMAHVFWSNVLLRDSTSVYNPKIFQNALDYLLYWNESFGASRVDTIAHSEDLNGDGIITIPTNGPNSYDGMGRYNGSITQLPSSGIDAAGNLYVSYQTLCENCDTTAYAMGFKHVYVKTSTDGGQSWSSALDVDQDVDALMQECVYACMAKNVDSCIHLIYQRDLAPGRFFDPLYPGDQNPFFLPDENDIIYAKIPVLSLGVKSISANESVELFQNAPNPASGITNIKFQLIEKAKVIFEVHNMLGELVYSEERGIMNAGSFSISLNTSEWSSGVYTYTLKVNDRKETKKLMVE